MRGVLNFFLRFRSELATDEVVLHGTIRLDSKIRFENVDFHDSFWREQTLAATKLFLSLTRNDFAAAVSSRAVRISSRAVRDFPALSLRRVRPSYGTFSLMVFQGNCARGCAGHMIIPNKIFPPIWGEKWRRSEHAYASYPGLFFHPTGFSPYMGREESRVQGLD